MTELKGRLANLDSELAAKQAEIASLNSQISALSNDENMNNSKEQADLEVDKIDEVTFTLKSVFFLNIFQSYFQELVSRNAQLQDLTAEAQRLGIKLKPGVWV